MKMWRLGKEMFLNHMIILTRRIHSYFANETGKQKRPANLTARFVEGNGALTVFDTVTHFQFYCWSLSMFLLVNGLRGNHRVLPLVNEGVFLTAPGPSLAAKNCVQLLRRPHGLFTHDVDIANISRHKESKKRSSKHHERVERRSRHHRH